MKFVVVAHHPSETNVALAGAAASLGLPASVLPPRDSLRNLEPGDVALARLDVRADLDGIETGMEELALDFDDVFVDAVLQLLRAAA